MKSIIEKRKIVYTDQHVELHDSSRDIAVEEFVYFLGIPVYSRWYSKRSLTELSEEEIPLILDKPHWEEQGRVTQDCLDNN